MNRLAIITGINGMDGFHLSKILLKKGYTIVGVQRRSSTSTAWRLKELDSSLNNKLILEPGDVTDYSSITGLIKKYKPCEFYNLAAMSHVWHSFRVPLSTVEITGMGALNCLEATRQELPECRFYQASSSEMFGNSGKIELLNENSPMIPRSPYGAAKLFAHNMVRNYREAYGMFAVGGILFNHESCYRGEEFVTRKITKSLAEAMSNLPIKKIRLGNINSCRDWGYAEDYMNAAWLMLQYNKPDDFVIATGKTYSVKDFFSLACLCVGIDDWESHIEYDRNLMRPSELDILIGDSSRAKKELGWSSTYSFIDIVYNMMEKDLNRLGALIFLKTKEEVSDKWNEIINI